MGRVRTGPAGGKGGTGVFSAGAAKMRKPANKPNKAPRAAPAVARLPSGRRPANSKWAGKKFRGKTWTKEMQEKYPDGVRFTKQGHPDFSPYKIDQVQWPRRFSGTHKDEAKANEKAGRDRTPDGYTWHHHEDKKTMQLIPRDMHEAVRHAGGRALLRK